MLRRILGEILYTKGPISVLASIRRWGPGGGGECMSSAPLVKTADSGLMAFSRPDWPQKINAPLSIVSEAVSCVICHLLLCGERVIAAGLILGCRRRLPGTEAQRSFHSVDPVRTNVLSIRPTSGASTRFVFTRMRADVSRSALAGQSEQRGKVLSVIYSRHGKLYPNRPIKKSMSASSSRPSAPLPSTCPLPPTTAPPSPPPSAAWPSIGAACFDRRLCSRRL